MTPQIVPVVLGAMLVAGTALGQNPSLRHLVTAKNEESKREEVEDVVDLARTFDRVGSAFELGDAPELEACLVERKIYLSLKARGEEAGYYGRSQVKFMFAKLFRERKTESFNYDPKDVELVGDGSTRFRADWSYMVLNRDDVVTEHLVFRFERANGDWRVSEIRAQLR